MISTITIELCQEDRARLDKIIEGLGKLGHHPDCSKCVKDVATVMDKACETIVAQQKAERAGEDEKNDDLDQALREVLAEAPKNAQNAPKASDHPTLDPFPEQPTEAKPAPTESVKAVSASDFQQLAIALCRQKKQPEIKKVLTEYGLQTVSEVLTKVPEDKHGEVYAKLKALEG